MATSSETPSASPSRRGDAPTRPGIVWDDSQMRWGYANVCNVTSTREEVVVVFGTHEGARGDGEPVRVALSEKMILSPFAAKRLSRLLNGVVEDYERRYGELSLGPGSRSGS